MRDDHVAILLEQIEGSIHQLAELIGDTPVRVKNIDERLERVESDVKAIKAAVSATSVEVKDHKERITSLEQAA